MPFDDVDELFIANGAFYAIKSGALLKSIDGKAWTQILAGVRAFAGTARGLLVSLDGGDGRHLHLLAGGRMWSAPAMPALSERRHGRRTPHRRVAAPRYFPSMNDTMSFDSASSDGRYRYIMCPPS